MSYVADDCPADSICLRSWWKSVIHVDRTIQGPHLNGRVTAAVMQHTGLNQRFKRRAHFFVLRRIDDPAQRHKLRADFFLEEMSEPRQMFCTAKDPREYGLSPDEIYESTDEDPKRYCYEMPRV